MADSEQRIKNLEEEFKLFKGEIKATLLDIRSQVMQQGAPFAQPQQVVATKAPARPSEEDGHVERVRIEERESEGRKRATSSKAEKEEGPSTKQPEQSHQPPQPTPAQGFPYPGMPGNGYQFPPQYPPGGPVPGPWWQFQGSPQPGPEPPNVQGPSGNGERMEAVGQGWSGWPSSSNGHSNGHSNSKSGAGWQQRPYHDGSQDPGASNWAGERRVHGTEAPQGGWRSQPHRGGGMPPTSQEDAVVWPMEEEKGTSYYQDSTLTERRRYRPGFEGALDTNLNTGLMRWSKMAKRHVGLERLRELVDLYISTGNGSPGLKRTIIHMAEMAKMPAEEMDGNGFLEPIDLIHQLHGILTSSQESGELPLEAVASQEEQVERVGHGESDNHCPVCHSGGSGRPGANQRYSSGHGPKH